MLTLSCPGNPHNQCITKPNYRPHGAKELNQGSSRAVWKVTLRRFDCSNYSSKIETDDARYRVFDRPIWKLCRVTEVTQVIDVAEQFVFERRIDDDRNRTVLVERARVALQTRREVGNVRYDFLNHHPPANANNTVKVKLSSATASGYWLWSDAFPLFSDHCQFLECLSFSSCCFFPFSFNAADLRSFSIQLVAPPMLSAFLMCNSFNLHKYARKQSTARLRKDFKHCTDIRGNLEAGFVILLVLSQNPIQIWKDWLPET